MSDEQPLGFMPDGPGWRCHQCGITWPEDYEPDQCENCGSHLSRVLARIELPEKS